MNVDQPGLRYYVFYFDDALEGEYAYGIVRDNELPHRIQKFQTSAYAGALGLGHGWGKIYVPEFGLEEFMRLTHNRLAPEPEMYTEWVKRDGRSWVARLLGRFGPG